MWEKRDFVLERRASPTYFPPHRWNGFLKNIWIISSWMLGLDAEVPKAMLADSGYLFADNVRHRGVDPYIAVSREGVGTAAPTPARSAADSQKASMREKLSTGKGKALYSRPKVIVEPALGQIEQRRGFRRFSQRGQAKVRRERALICLTHNLLKLFRHQQRGSPTTAPLLAQAG